MNLIFLGEFHTEESKRKISKNRKGNVKEKNTIILVNIYQMKLKGKLVKKL